MRKGAVSDEQAEIDERCASKMRLGESRMAAN